MHWVGVIEEEKPKEEAEKEEVEEVELYVW